MGSNGGLDKPEAEQTPEAAKSFSKVRDIYCTGCERLVEARLTNGAERYPHRPDLYDLPFWKCDICGAWVGCHHKTAQPTTPLGYLATPAILDARKKIHALLDPLWKSGKIKRGQAYAYVTNRMIKETGDQLYQYHNGEIKTIEEGRQIYRIVAQLHNEVSDLVATGSQSQVEPAPIRPNHQKEK